MIWDPGMWRDECSFISDATSKKGLMRAFNHDTACFIRYCEMQRDKAEREKRLDVVQYIQHCIDDLKG